MEYVSKFIPSENGLSEQQINVILNELDKLIEMYPKVEIKTIGDLYSSEKIVYDNRYDLVSMLVMRDGYSEEDAKKFIDKTFKEPKIEEVGATHDEEGKYLSNDRDIKINHHKVKGLLFEDECIVKRKKLRERIELRKSLGIDVGGTGDRIWNECRCVEGLIRHEVAHAIAYQYAIDVEQEMLDLFNSLAEEQIINDLAEYALKDSNEDIHEFIAVGFEESFFDDCSELAKQIRKIIDKCVAEKNPMSGIERSFYLLGLKYNG